jgi:hypothetical protein
MGRCERLAVVEVLRRILRQVGGSDEQSEAILLLLERDEDLRREVRAIMADARLQPRLHPGKRFGSKSTFLLQRQTPRFLSSWTCRTISESC